MEAPEKIYLFRNPIGVILDSWYLNPNAPFEKIEYIHKDAFIDKAVNFLEILGYAYTITDNSTKSLYDNTQLIEDFKKYMEK